jgi:hypothetical protein
LTAIETAFVWTLFTLSPTQVLPRSGWKVSGVGSAGLRR